MKQFYLILSLLFVVHFSSAQLLKGRVVDGETQKPIEGAVISNVNSRQIALTDSSGHYTLVANFNHEILISFQGYKTQTKKVAPSQFGISILNVELMKLSYQLDEFIFRPKYTRYQLDSMERKSVYVRVLSREKSAITSPISWFVEKFNANSKRIIKFQKSFNYWETQKFIESRYSPEIVEKLTNLHGDTLATFINNYPLPYDYARVASDLEIKIFIRDSYKQWLQHPVYPTIVTLDSLKTNKH